MDDIWTPAHLAVKHEDAQTLARLLADGADPDKVLGAQTLLTHALDVEGDSALQSGQPLTVHTTAILLAFGADPRLRDPAGNTPMDVAEEYDHQPAIKLLVLPPPAFGRLRRATPALPWSVVKTVGERLRNELLRRELVEAMGHEVLTGQIGARTPHPSTRFGALMRGAGRLSAPGGDRDCHSWTSGLVQDGAGVWSTPRTGS
ncbi:hypothetical protein [Streptomyces sp. NPDC002250]|uniref:hypothetical protein n=1 Tax=Streptomyces sp. NPDC002250 TaxID=3364641 RepID=UPI0036B26AA4